MPVLLSREMSPLKNCHLPMYIKYTYIQALVDIYI